VKFSVRQDFPTTLDCLWAAFGHADYPQQKYRALGSTELRMLHFTATRNLIEVELARTVSVAAQALPAWARAFVAGEPRIHQQTRWRRVSPTQVDALLDFVPAGLPVEAHATGTVIEPVPGQTRMTLNFDVQSRLPVVGAKVARLFARQVQEALAADHAFTLKYLEQR
jgi:hypothetical protein